MKTKTGPRSSVLALPLLAVSLLAPNARAQFGDPAKVTLKTTGVTPGISMIEGVNGFAGGNVAVSVGDDGVFVVDDEIAPMTAKLKTAVTALSKKPVRFVINTHWHPDHTGGDPAMAAAGAVIVAQDNVRKRLSVENVRTMSGHIMKTPAFPLAALPIITFGEDVTLHLNGDDVHVIHMPPAHTDGDAIVHFQKANVIHTGDVVVGGYPVIDGESGGTLTGMIAAVDKILALTNDNTKLIPGHGPVMTKAEVTTYREMLVTVRDRVGKLMAQKKSLDEAKAAKPLADLDARWGVMFKGDDVVEMVYKAFGAAPEPTKAKRHAN